VTRFRQAEFFFKTVEVALPHGLREAYQEAIAAYADAVETGICGTTLKEE